MRPHGDARPSFGNQGFTLVEVLIALFICVLIGAAALHVASAALGIEQRARDSEKKSVQLGSLMAAREGGWSSPANGFSLASEEVEHEGRDWKRTSLVGPSGSTLCAWSAPVQLSTNATPRKAKF